MIGIHMRIMIFALKINKYVKLKIYNSLKKLINYFILIYEH